MRQNNHQITQNFDEEMIRTSHNDRGEDRNIYFRSAENQNLRREMGKGEKIGE
jgi:hypothetical protein